MLFCNIWEFGRERERERESNCSTAAFFYHIISFEVVKEKKGDDPSFVVPAVSIGALWLPLYIGSCL